MFVYYMYNWVFCLCTVLFKALLRYNFTLDSAPLFKVNNLGWGCSTVVERLLSTWKALCLVPSTAKRSVFKHIQSCIQAILCLCAHVWDRIPIIMHEYLGISTLYLSTHPSRYIHSLYSLNLTPMPTGQGRQPTWLPGHCKCCGTD